MPRWKKYSLITIGTIIGLLLLSMLIVPWQIKVQGSKWFAENTTRTLTIEKAFFNPFALTVEVKGVTLTEQQSSQPFVAFDRLMISGSVRSLIDLALILDRVELDAPYVNIELLGKQEFNFSDFTHLRDDQPEPVAEEPSQPLLFSLNNIIIDGGAIDFTDQTSPKKSKHQITELSLSVPFVGNVPYLTDEYVEPQLRLLLNGSEVSATGHLKPFHESLETSLSLGLNDIDLAFYAFHSPVPLPIEVKSGTLDTEINLIYRISSDEQPKLLLRGELALSDIDLRELDDDPLFLLPTLILELDSSDLMQQNFNLLSLDIYEPEIYVRRNTDGLWNFQQLLPPAAEGESAEPVEVDSEMEGQEFDLPLVAIEAVALFNGKLHFDDQLPTGGVREELHDINLRLQEVSTQYDQKTALEFWLATDRQLTTSIKGNFGINPPTAGIDLLVNGVPLEPYYPYVAEILTAPVAGTLNMAGTVNYTADGNLLLEHGQVALHELKVPFDGNDEFTLADLTLSGGSFDLQGQQAGLATVKLAGGNLSATRFADGSVSPLKLLRAQSTAEEQPETEEPPAAEEESGPAFAVAVGQFDLNDFNLHFTDASLPKKPQVKVDQLTVSLSDLAYPDSAQSPFKIAAKVGKKGNLALSGQLAHSPLRLKANAQVKSLALADFNDFLPENVKVSLRDGKFHTRMAVTLAETSEALTGSFGGDLSVSDFNLRDPLGEGELLAWENLNLDGIKGEIAPFKLVIKEVALSQYLAKIQIDPEGRVNLSNVTAAEEMEETATEAEKVEEPEVVAVAVEDAVVDDTPPADIRIDALTLQGGTVSFIDRSMPNTFSATMYKLGGRVTGMASDEEMQADVDLRGELENHSPLTITGKLNPLSKDLYADLTIKFKDIDLAPMTPYSGTYLGKVIDKGKLYLDLSYQIEHQKITADNKIMIDQFTLGDPVKSDKATSLPIGLAIALLKDTNDEIHLDVPISGDLNDPSFSIMGTIFTVLKNLLVKAATAPFSLLTGMLGGGGGDDFTNLAFDSGIARLDEAQLETLDKLAGMLEKRPALILELSAFADPAKDPEAYRKDQLMQKMLAVKRQELKDDDAPAEVLDAVVISAEEYPVYLLEAYKLAEFPRPRNFVGMLQTLPDEEMEKLLLANIRVDDEVLQTLAQNRALAVRDALISKHEGIKPQIFQKTVDPYLEPEKGPASRVEFNITTK